MAKGRQRLRPLQHVVAVLASVHRYPRQPVVWGICVCVCVCVHVVCVWLQCSTPSVLIESCCPVTSLIGTCMCKCMFMRAPHAQFSTRGTPAHTPLMAG